MHRILRGAAVAAALLIAPVTVGAAGDMTAENAQKLIFESSHLDLVGKGREVTYRYEHQVSDETRLGKPYTDDIRLSVTKVDASGKRDVRMQVFFKELARNPWGETGITLNPIFIWFLNNSVKQFSSISAGGDFSDLKNRFKAGIYNDAELAEVKATFDGKEVDAYKLTMMPFANDQNSRKMDGYERSTFVVVFSPAVPGYFLELTANLESRKQNYPKVVERVSLVKVGETQ